MGVAGTLRFIATITEESAITKILDSLGLASSPPLRRARAPDPQLDYDLVRLAIALTPPIRPDSVETAFEPT